MCLGPPLFSSWKTQIQHEHNTGSNAEDLHCDVYRLMTWLLYSMVWEGFIVDIKEQPEACSRVQRSPMQKEKVDLRRQESGEEECLREEKVGGGRKKETAGLQGDWIDGEKEAWCKEEGVVGEVRRARILMNFEMCNRYLRYWRDIGYHWLSYANRHNRYPFVLSTLWNLWKWEFPLDLGWCM